MAFAFTHKGVYSQTLTYRSLSTQVLFSRGFGTGSSYILVRSSQCFIDISLFIYIKNMFCPCVLSLYTLCIRIWWSDMIIFCWCFTQEAFAEFVGSLGLVQLGRSWSSSEAMALGSHASLEPEENGPQPWIKHHKSLENPWLNILELISNKHLRIHVSLPMSTWALIF